MKYSVCIDAVFRNKGTVTQAMEKVAGAGYKAIEFWSWWDKDIDAIESACQKLGLAVAAFCTKFVNPGDAQLRDDYLAGLTESIAVARRLGCGTLIAQAGWELESFPKGITRRAHRLNLQETMKRAADIAENAGVTLVLEPLNLLVNHPGYHLSASDDAFHLIEQIGSPYVKILFDIYHQQITEGNLIRNITDNIGKIGHFHAAGNPGRNEITKGEIHYRNVLSAIRDTGYNGYFGLEYMTDEEPTQGLLDAKQTILL